jgi:hypothetical protein
MNYHGLAKEHKDRLDRILDTVELPQGPRPKLEFRTPQEIHSACMYALSLDRFSEKSIRRLQQNEAEFYSCIESAFKGKNKRVG